MDDHYYAVSSRGTFSLLKLKKKYFKKCYEERIIFSKKCINNTYDYGHKKVIVLNKKAENECYDEVYIINKILRFE